MAQPLESTDPRDRLIFALDVDSADEAIGWADRLYGAVRWFKIGPRLFTGTGPQLVDQLIARSVRNAS